MSKERGVRAEITEVLGGGRFRVKLGDGREVIAYVGGKMKTRGIRVGLLDKVEVILDPAGGNATNRITWRL